MDTNIVNALERSWGLDLNGDGYIGGEGYISMLERATQRDIDGDGLIGRLPDVAPGHPAIYDHPSILYGPGDQMHATNNFVGPQQQQHHHHHHRHHHSSHF